MVGFTSAGLPTPTIINLPSSKPTRMWLYSLVTEMQWIGSLMANGEMLRLRLKRTKNTEEKYIMYLLAHTAKNHMYVKLLSMGCTVKHCFSRIKLVVSII